MDKNELIHTHAMLAEVRNFVNRTNDVPTPEYDELGVNPIGLTSTAEDHEDAVFALADELSTGLTDQNDTAATAEVAPGINAD